jgi:hypothetical protein
VLPFPLSYNKSPAPNVYRNIIRKLRGQLRIFEKVDDSNSTTPHGTGFQMQRPNFSDGSVDNKDGTSKPGRGIFMTEMNATPRHIAKGKSVGQGFPDIKENPGQLLSGMLSNNEISTKDSNS